MKSTSNVNLQIDIIWIHETDGLKEIMNKLTIILFRPFSTRSSTNQESWGTSHTLWYITSWKYIEPFVRTAVSSTSSFIHFYVEHPLEVIICKHHVI